MMAACLTTYNEAKSIGALVRVLCSHGLRVFVCDANSQDDTWRIANDNGATVNVNQQRVPMAEGYRRAWAMALEAGCDPIVQLDAGGSHDPLDAVRLAQVLEGLSVDLVIGSRFCVGARYVGNPTRAQLSRLAAALCNLKTGARFTDWTSGYRAFTRDALLALLWRDDVTPWTYRAQKHGWQIEVLDHARRCKMEIAESPITYRAGRSSFDLAAAREAFQVWGRL